MQSLVRQLLEKLGEDPDREGLKNTPKRFEKAMRLRSGNMKGRKLTRPTKENPRAILLLDEMLSLPKKLYSDGTFSPLGRILSSGGAALYTVFGCNCCTRPTSQSSHNVCTESDSRSLGRCASRCRHNRRY